MASEGDGAGRGPEGDASPELEDPRELPTGLDGHPCKPELERVPSWLVTTTAWTWRMLVVLLGAAVLLYIAVQLSLVTLPVIIALILATLCVPPARLLERIGLPRAAAASVVVIGGLGAFGGFIALLTPPFVEQVQELGPTVTEALDKIFAWSEETFGYDQSEIMELLQQGVDQLTERSGEIAGQVAAVGAVVVQFFIALSLALVLLFFFVKDGAQIVDWFIARSPESRRGTVRAVGRRAWAALSGFIRGTALVALIDAVGIGVGLAILGVPLVLPLAVLTFFGGFIPVIGAFVTGLLAVLVALADSGGDLVVPLIVLAIVVGVQQFESNVLQPVIMRRAVSLHPVVILGALTAGGALIGVVGAFLAVPIAAVVSAVGNELRLRHEAAANGVPLDDDPDALGPPQDPVDSDLV
ncbi:AI-2E family transporter [Nitriliruptoraceae bacterium ZYF776]|nr:AI-2E family transporter [Profundirhabdus halotolerans]